MKKRVFVSHPYVDNPERNKAKVNIICKNLVKEGYLPISPLHLFSFMDEDGEREEILQFCYELIDNCDIVHIYGDSEGCLLECKYALSKFKRVEIKYR